MAEKNKGNELPLSKKIELVKSLEAGTVKKRQLKILKFVEALLIGSNIKKMISIGNLRLNAILLIAAENIEKLNMKN